MLTLPSWLACWPRPLGLLAVLAELACGVCLLSLFDGNAFCCLHLLDATKKLERDDDNLLFEKNDNLKQNMKGAACFLALGQILSENSLHISNSKAI